MIEREKILDHLAHAASFGAGLQVPFDTTTTLWTVDAPTLASGTLDVLTTRSIHERYCELHANETFGAQPVPVLACLAWLEQKAGDGESRTPVLLLPGLLEANGTLSMRPGGRPWIPRELLDDGTGMGGALAICDLDAYRVHQQAMEALQQDPSWSNTVNLAYDLLFAVSTLEKTGMGQFGVRLETNSCTLRLWEEDDPLTDCATMLVRAMDRKDNDAPDALADCLLGNDTPTKGDERTDEASDDTVLGRLLTAGMPDHLDVLTPNDRAVMATYARQAEGDLLVVRTPLGTHGTALAASMMGQVLTERALRGESAPFMLCVAPAATVTAFAEAFCHRPTAALTALSSRWIPRIASGRDGAKAADEAERRTLGPLGSVVSTHTRGDVTFMDSTTTLNEPLGHPLDGAAAAYAEAWYTPRATTYYLDCVSSFLGKRVRNVREAASMLGERLRHIDQDRSELIHAYEELCDASLNMRKREELVAQLGTLRRDHHIKRKRLAYWASVCERYPSKRAIMGTPQTNPADVVSQHALPNETLTQGCATPEEVCDAYRAEVERIESAIDRLRGNTAELSRGMRLATAKANECTEAIARLIGSCGFVHEQADLLESVMDGREADRDRLDDALDKTVRPAEFWLAIHVFEAHWLESNANGSGLERAIRTRSTKTHALLSEFCPIQLIDVELAPALLSKLGTGGQAAEQTDLLIAMDAEAIDAVTGLSLLFGARRAVVMGTEAGFGSPQPYGSTSEEVLASHMLSPQEWQELCERRLTLAGGSSFLCAALHAHNMLQTVALTDLMAPYGELADFRSDLFATEPVATNRIPANSADDAHYPLSRIVPSLSYVLVPDSAWMAYGASRKNEAEAKAIVRWLCTRVERIAGRYAASKHPVIAVTSLFASQNDVLRALIREQQERLDGIVEVVDLHQTAGRTWPVVLLSTTCGPESYARNAQACLESALACAAAAAHDALLAFCGGAWIKSPQFGSSVLIKRALRMGKLFSVARPITAQGATNQQGENIQSQAKSQPNVELRVKPYALTRLLLHMEQRGLIEQAPPTQAVNLVLEHVGLIERHTNAEGKQGWRPTSSGREIGILPSIDRSGNPFCSYTGSTEPVIQNIVENMLAERTPHGNGKATH